jgi:malate synthase
VKIRVGLAAPEPLNLMNDDIRKEGLKMNGSNATDYLDQWINGSNYLK